MSMAATIQSVVSFSNKWVRNGILNEKQLHWVWLDFPRYLHPLLLRIFERFQVSATLSLLACMHRVSLLDQRLT
jgi:hypothetical protein